MKKLLILGVIALFIGLAFIPSFNAVSISKKENHPPDKPNIHGPKTGYLGVEYSFTINATDPDGDNITYIVDWCDGSVNEYGPYYSGTEISANHTWHSEDMFTILVNARDIHYLEGGLNVWWIIIGKSKDINQIIETTDDCDCQSNGKTHLAEKIVSIYSHVLDIKSAEDCECREDSDVLEGDYPILCDILLMKMMGNIVIYLYLVEIAYKIWPISYELATFIEAKIASKFYFRAYEAYKTAESYNCSWIVYGL
ncbi:hypothetical protein AYK21_06600 [Thermoplasmatales archaeon SG8-52-2]|nr:MAG: hypothetical protein AYK21_06600 [Thermoplasmatales archaeon SG8-52-2]